MRPTRIKGKREMKKLFTMMGVAAMSALAMAQSVTTHSVYDVNQNGEVNVADAVSVAQATLQEVDPEQTQQYVTAEDLSKLLQGIQNDLTLIKEKLGITNGAGGTEDQGGTEGDNNPDTDPYNGHEYVDLGVVVDGKPVYWATTNIGAELPADYGLYFAWGETEGYGSTPLGTDYGSYVEILDGRKFDWASYSSALCDGSSSTMKKYCTDSDYGIVDNKTVLDPEDDAAHVNWQGAWRMPTEAEQDALRTQCTWTWTTMTNSAGKSINGYKVSNKADSSKFIFLPAAGCRHDDHLDDAGSYGNYWSSSLSASLGSNYAYYLIFLSDLYRCPSSLRCCGQSVRPVCQ